MRKALTLIAILLCAAIGSAQTPAEQLRHKIENGRLELQYKYEVNGKVPVGGNGSLILEGSSFRMEGNGLQIISDGKSQWTVDPDAKEVYIEESDGAATFIAHPELLLDNATNLEITDKQISGIYHDPSSGAAISFKLWGLKFSDPRGNGTEFICETDSLDSSWVVTDLR